MQCKIEDERMGARNERVNGVIITKEGEEKVKVSGSSFSCPLLTEIGTKNSQRHLLANFFWAILLAFSSEGLEPTYPTLKNCSFLPMTLSWLGWPKSARIFLPGNQLSN